MVRGGEGNLMRNEFPAHCSIAPDGRSRAVQPAPRGACRRGNDFLARKDQNVKNNGFSLQPKGFHVFLLIAGLLSLASGLGQAATYYVSVAGNDSNAGTQTAPFRHVSHGAAVAHAGDTVVVMNGTYDNEGQVADPNTVGAVVTVSNAGTAGNPITIMAQNRGGAILDAASTQKSSLGCSAAWAYFDLSYTSYVVIQGFAIRNGCINGIRANGNAHDLTIRWNEIYNIGNWNNPAGGSSPSGMYVNHDEYNVTFDGNTFHDIGGGTNVNQQHALYISAHNVTVVNNTFYNQVHGWDIQVAGAHDLFIVNNTFAFPNPNREGHVILWDDNTANSLQNILIENNTFYHPQTYAVITALGVGSSITGCQLNHNLTTTPVMYDNGAPCAQLNNVTSTDPMMVNTATSPYDFHLQNGSPAIDNGLNNSYTARDHDALSRPVNNLYDLSAYEYRGN
jgi:hypothetical protein